MIKNNLLAQASFGDLKRLSSGGLKYESSF